MRECLTHVHCSSQQGTMKGMVGGWFDNIKMLWRYGITSPMNAQKLCVAILDPASRRLFWLRLTHVSFSVKTMTDQFVQLYNPETPSWENITDLIDAFHWSELVSSTGAEYYTSHGVSPLFTNEIIESLTRVNYAQVYPASSLYSCKIPILTHFTRTSTPFMH